MVLKRLLLRFYNLYLVAREKVFRLLTWLNSFSSLRHVICVALGNVGRAKVLF